MNISLANEKHIDKDGKVFIGWKNVATNKYPQTTNGVASLKSGDILVAEFVDYTGKFVIEDTPFRHEATGGSTAIRYVINKDKAFEDLINPYESGAIYTSADEAQGFEIFIGKKPVKSWYAYANENGGSNAEWAVRETVGSIPTKVVANPNYILEETKNNVKYTLCLQNISQADYNKFYAVRGYMLFTDKNGIDSAVYTPQLVSSLYKAACSTPKSERVTDINTVINTVTDARSAGRQSFFKSLTTPWDNGKNLYADGKEYSSSSASTLEKENKMIFYSSQYGGMYVRWIEIDTGITGFQQTNLIAVTDTHVTYTNEHDINTNFVNALEYYKSRAYSGSSINHRRNFAGKAINAVNLASLFDKIVHCGDMMDYVSDGNYQSVKRIWTDRSVMNGKTLKGSLSFAPGNHEFSQSSNPNKFTEQEMHDKLNKVMPNNSYIDYDIVLDKQGNESYMTIVMDNASGEDYSFYECQVEPFRQYIEYAKTNNLPVLIFQHVAYNTGDKADSEIWFRAPEYYKYTIGGRKATTAVMNKFAEWKASNPNATDSEKSKWVKNNAYDVDVDGDGSLDKWILINGYDSYEHTGADYIKGTDTTSPTAQIFSILKANPDTIKAVFAGHHHASYNTNILADGGKTIPQYVSPASYQDFVTCIEMK